MMPNASGKTSAGIQTGTSSAMTSPAGRSAIAKAQPPNARMVETPAPIAPATMCATAADAARRQVLARGEREQLAFARGDCRAEHPDAHGEVAGKRRRAGDAPAQHRPGEDLTERQGRDADQRQCRDDVFGADGDSAHLLGVCLAVLVPRLHGELVHVGRHHLAFHGGRQFLGFGVERRGGGGIELRDLQPELLHLDDRLRVLRRYLGLQLVLEHLGGRDDFLAICGSIFSQAEFHMMSAPISGSTFTSSMYLTVRDNCSATAPNGGSGAAVIAPVVIPWVMPVMSSGIALNPFESYQLCILSLPELV